MTDDEKHELSRELEGLIRWTTLEALKDQNRSDWRCARRYRLTPKGMRHIANRRGRRTLKSGIDGRAWGRRREGRSAHKPRVFGGLRGTDV